MQLNPFCPNDPKIITRGTEEPRPMSITSLRLQRSILWIFHIPPLYVVGCFFNWSSLFSNEMEKKDNKPTRGFFLEKELVGWLAPWTSFSFEQGQLKTPFTKTRDIFWKIWYLCVMGCHSWVVRTLRSTV